MSRSSMYAVVMALFMAVAPNLCAETLQMPTQERELISIQLPGRGMSMVAVEERFGSPRERVEEVGEPPITRWVYDDFTVYFEYQYVIHAVMHDQQ